MTLKINPSYGPLTDEEYQQLLLMEDEREALVTLLTDLVERQRTTETKGREWWKAIREKYNVTTHAVRVDPDTKRIQTINLPKGGN